MPTISVIICTHNPKESYLRRTLDALKKQTLPKQEWELLLIDNASDTPLSETWDLSWHPLATHIRENEIGLTPARLCGIRESRGQLLVFVDDDNVLDQEYLANARGLSMEYDKVGAYGGSNFPEFETEPAKDIIPQLGGLALGEVSDPKISNELVFTDATPFGAGMCVRRQVALRYIDLLKTDPLRRSFDRSGKLLGAGGDTDIALCACDLGMSVGRFPSLKLVHIISSSRLTVDYMERIFEGFGMARIFLKHIRNPQESIIAPSRIRILRTLARWYLARLTGDSQRRISARGFLGELKARRILTAILTNKP